jgi:putative ABC transport system substrate-binding protein
MRQVGVIFNGAASDPIMRSYLAAFEQGLRALGWMTGRNLHIQYRWYTGDVAVARSDVAQLMALGPDVVVTASSTVLNAVREASSTATIVFTAVIDPVAQGFVSNLAHPGGNITGFATLEYSMGGKWLDLLKQSVPSIARVAFMFNPDSFPPFKGFMSAIEAAGPSLGVETLALPIHGEPTSHPPWQTFRVSPTPG